METKPKLPIHEWTAVISIVILLLLITLITTFHQQNPMARSVGEPHHIISPEIEVTVEGAVEHPGTFQLKRGALVKDALELAKPLPEANLNKIKPEAKLRDGRVLKVPFYAMITIDIEGEIAETGSRKVRKGTRLQDLIQIFALTEEIDIEPLKKKRKLKDGEKIVIRKKEKG